MMKNLLAVILILNVLACQADIYIVTHKDNPVESLLEQEVRDLYLARSKAWPNGEFVRVFDCKSPQLREKFFQNLTGMSLRQLDAYWARLVFAGRVLPLESIENEQALLGIAEETIDVLGYIDKPPVNNQLKVLYVINTSE